MNEPPAPFPNRRHWLLLAAGLAVLFVGFLGSRGLNEPDEGRYANIAQAMTRPGGGWWEPRMSGYGHYDKPPLVYWVTAASFRLFGLHEWSARLPSLLGAACTLVGLGWAAFRLRGGAVAWWAVLIGGTSVQCWVFGRILSPDMLLTGWCTLAVAAWAEARWRLTMRPGGAWGWWLLSLALWTLAWWTKATPALIPLLGLTAGVFLTGDGPGRRALQPWLLFPGIIALGSPWYLSMLSTYPELKGFFFGRELAGRLAGRVDGRHGHFLYYLPVSLVAWLPWWPLGAFLAWKNRRRFSSDAAPLPWRQRPGVEGWMVLVGLLILSLTASKLPSYTLTLAPWAALLLARVIAPRATTRPFVWREPLLWPAAGFFAVTMLGSATLPRRFESRLGVNSSVREVAGFLRQQGAAQVDAERYLPGLEFYLDENRVRYIVRIDGAARSNPSASGRKRPPRIERYHERASDPGVPPDRFVDPDLWPVPPPTQAPGQSGWWIVSLHRREPPRFLRNWPSTAGNPRPVKVRRIGDFDLYRMPVPPPPVTNKYPPP